MQVAMIGSPHCSTYETTAASGLPEINTNRFWQYVFPARLYADHLWDVARDCFENIGFLRSQRAPLPHENWRAPAKAEQRLLNQIDAVIACGPEVLKRALDSVLESEIPDAESAFALILVLGCISGTEAVRLLIGLFETLALRDKNEARAAAEAMALAPNPELRHAIQSFVAQSSPKRALAAEVLWRRGELSSEQISGLLSCGDPELIIVGLRAAAVAKREGNPAPFLHHQSEPVVYAALAACFSRSNFEGRRRALELVALATPHFADATFWLGLSGDVGDLNVLAPLLDRESTSKRTASALGYWGYGAAVRMLLDKLKDSDPESKRTLIRAIERITGANVSYWNNESQEFVAATIDAYEGWFGEHESEFQWDKRFRRGRQYGLAALFSELSDGIVSAREREIAQLELTRISPIDPPFFRVDSFVQTQLQAIHKWKASCGLG